MPQQGQLEIISPGGQIEFHQLDAARGVTNIGSHPDNDIVLDSAGIEPFHILVDHQERPYRIMLLGESKDTMLDGQPLASNVFQEVHGWDTIELDGYTIVLLEEDGPEAPRHLPGAAPGPIAIAAVPAALAPTAPPMAEPAAEPGPLARPAGLPARPRDQADEIILANLSAREWAIDVEQMAAFQVSVANGGDLVATFNVDVEGLDESWVAVSPAHVNLYEGGKANVTVAIEPPRSPDSSAGLHHFAVVVTSPNYPGRKSVLGATISLNPYYEFALGELSPKQQTIPWRKRTGVATLPITNKGNSETPFRLDAEDDERACRFEFEIPDEEALLIRQAELRLPAGQSYDLPVSITPVRRRLVALRKRAHAYTITTTLLEGTQMPRAVMGQVKAAPLIGPWLLLLMALCGAALLAWLFRPVAAPALAASPPNPDPGQEIGLSYDVRRFPGLSRFNILNRMSFFASDVHLDYRPGESDWQPVLVPSDFEEPIGRFAHVPPGNGKYRLRADTWLSKLVPILAGTPAEVLVFVTPVEPRIVDFKATPPSTLVGQEVLVSWRVADAEMLKLEYEGVEETLQDTELETGSRSFPLEQDTTFTLIASNSSWPGEVRKPLQVPVGVPTRTPMPTPVIVRFDVDPLTITAGDTVRVSWEVLGADSVSIEPIGADFLLQGDVGHQPAALTNYKLVAIKAADDGTEVRNSTSKEVFVNPLPSPTPEPVPPEIQLFKALPEEVILGDNQEVKLTWSVAGATTNIEITAPNLKLSGLEAQDTITVTARETTLFVLTAYNGDLSRSVPAEVAALEPTPTPTLPPPPTATPTPTPTPLPSTIVYYRAEGLNPPADVVTFQTSYDTDAGIVYEYDVQAGSMVKLSWKVTNVDTVTLQNFGPQPPESDVILPTALIAPATYMLSAENPGGVVNAFVKLELVPKPAPPPPYDLDGVETQVDGKPAIVLTWYYDRAFVQEIDGFRVYRADVSSTGDGVFQPVTVLFGEDTWANRSKFDWVDTLDDLGGRICGNAYYLTAFYWDVVSNRERETDSSTTSYYSSPCNQ